MRHLRGQEPAQQHHKRHTAHNMPHLCKCFVHVSQAKVFQEVIFVLQQLSGHSLLGARHSHVCVVLQRPPGPVLDLDNRMCLLPTLRHDSSHRESRNHITLLLLPVSDTTTRPTAGRAVRVTHCAHRGGAEPICRNTLLSTRKCAFEGAGLPPLGPARKPAKLIVHLCVAPLDPRKLACKLVSIQGQRVLQ